MPVARLQPAPPDADEAVSRLAAAIGEPARTRMLYTLVDGRARTSTELAAASGVTPPTASAHLNRLLEDGLVAVQPQGKHRYYRLAGPRVARVLEGLSVLAGARPAPFRPSTPVELRAARTCYDHVAGALGVALYDRLLALRYMEGRREDAPSLTTAGERALTALGVDVAAARASRRRFAYGCVDWSERRPHLGGALAAALLEAALRRKWVVPELASRALEVTAVGRRELQARLGVSLAD